MPIFPEGMSGVGVPKNGTGVQNFQGFHFSSHTGHNGRQSRQPPRAPIRGAAKVLVN